MSTIASTIPYSDPQLDMLRKRRARALRDARTLTLDDAVVASTVVHRTDGTVVLVQSTRQGHVYWAPLRLDESGTAGADWQPAAPPVPNTPAVEAMEEVRRLDAMIANRIETRGGRTGHLLVDGDEPDVTDLVDVEDGEEG